MQHNLAFYQLLYGNTELFVPVSSSTPTQVHATKQATPNAETAMVAEPVTNAPTTKETPKHSTYPARPVCVVTDVLDEANLEQLTRMLAALKFNPAMVVHRQMLVFEKPTLEALALSSKASHILVFTDEQPDDAQLTHMFTPFLWGEITVARFNGFNSIRTSGDVKKAVWAAINQLNF
jgi:hypothetical protein